MISVETAWKKIAQELSTAPVTTVWLNHALGYVTAENIYAPESLPSFTASAMDGFAVLSKNVEKASAAHPVRLRVIETVPAGKVPGRIIRKGNAARIFTGAAMPKGADAVVIQENTSIEDGVAVFDRPVKRGENVRKQGEEIKKGSIAVRRGSYVNPPLLGFLASLGIKRIKVFNKPVVSFFTTGDELIAWKEKLRPGKIRDSHSLSVPAALGDTGVPVRVLKPCRDDLVQLTLRIKRALSVSDIVVISGGVSVGEHDLVKEALLENKITPVFWRVAMKPGKPLFFGKKGRKIVFGVPGNPAAALASTYLFIRPAIFRMAGLKSPFPKTLRAKLAGDHTNKGGRTEFLRGKTEMCPSGTIAVRILKGQGSHMLQSFAQADCLIAIPARKKKFNKGDSVIIHLLPWASP